MEMLNVNSLSSGGLEKNQIMKLVNMGQKFPHQLTNGCFELMDLV